MSTTLPLPAPGERAVDPAVDARSYAAAVRGELQDLPVDVVEELAGGLEADLAELAAESSTPLADRLGDPRGYAAELRAAAGLPPRGAPAGGPAGAWAGTWAGAAEGLRSDRDRVLASLRSRPWWPGAVERAGQLRPAWWVARGLVATWLVLVVVGVHGRGLPALVLALLVVAASVEVGRRAPAGHWPRALVLSGDVLAVLLLPFALAAVLAGGQTVYVDTSSASGPDTSTGVWVDGERVANLYPYDAQGRPLTGVQLLDDRGRPVSTTTGGTQDWSGYQPVDLSPAVDVEGAVRWNAYPLKAQDQGSGAPTVPPLPQPTLAALVGAGASAAPTPASAATEGSSAPTAVEEAAPTTAP